MKSIYLSRLCGFYLILVGLMVIIGWIFHIPLFISFYSSSASMVFNTALCLILLGAALFRFTQENPVFSEGNLVLAGASLTITSLTLLQYLSGHSLGIDQLFIRAWLSDANPYPGRMAFNSNLCLLIASFVILIVPYARKKWLGILVQCCIAIVFFLGLTAILGYLLKLRFLYGWDNYSEMALHTAIAMIALSLGLGVIWLYHPNYQIQYNNSSEKKILLLCYLVLFCAIYISGLTGFSISKKNNELLLQNTLTKILENKITGYQTEINHSLHNMNLLQELLSQSLVIPATLLNDLGFTSIAIYDNQQTLRYHQGAMIQAPALKSPVNLLFNARLLWKNGWVLQYQNKIIKNKKLRGFVKVQWPLTRINKMASNHDQLGKSEAFIICAPIVNHSAFCASSLSSQPFVVNLLTDNNRYLIKNALTKMNGIYQGLDYQKHQVIAAYGVIPNLGITIIHKIDSPEFYQIIRVQLDHTVAILIVATLVSILFIYWLIHPLLYQVVESERVAHASEKRFHSAFDHAAVGMAMIGLNGNWLKVNKTLCSITGYAESELLSTTYQAISYPDDLEEQASYIKQLVNGDINTYQMEKRYYHKKGHVIWVLVCVSLLRDDHNQPLYFIVQIQDIDKQKKAEQQLRYQAYHDTLTGLLNRNKLEENLESAIIAAQSNQQLLAVLFMDLDYFKMINDEYGHQVGDSLLQEVAQRLKKSFRANDIIARLGGDEFIIVITDVKELAQIVIPVEKCMKLIHTPFTIKNHELSISSSIGISVYPNDGHDNETLIKKADRALYEAKKNDRNNYQFFTADATIETHKSKA